MYFRDPPRVSDIRGHKRAAANDVEGAAASEVPVGQHPSKGQEARLRALGIAIRRRYQWCSRQCLCDPEQRARPEIGKVGESGVESSVGVGAVALGDLHITIGRLHALEAAASGVPASMRQERWVRAHPSNTITVRVVRAVFVRYVGIVLRCSRAV